MYSCVSFNEPKFNLKIYNIFWRRQDCRVTFVHVLVTRYNVNNNTMLYNNPVLSLSETELFDIELEQHEALPQTAEFTPLNALEILDAELNIEQHEAVSPSTAASNVTLSRKVGSDREIT